MDPRAAPRELDAWLAEFLAERDEEKSRRLLDRLFIDHIDPLVNKIVRSALPALWGPEWSVAFQDIKSEVTVRLVDRLHRVKTHPQVVGVEDLLNYTAVTSYNTCYSHFRLKKPRRWKLRNRIRYVLTRADSLDIWESDGRRWLSGRVGWRETKTTPCPIGKLSTLSENPVLLGAAAAYTQVPQEDPTALLIAIFDVVENPVDIDDLVDLLAEWWGIKDGKDTVELEKFERCQLLEGNIQKAPAFSEQIDFRVRLDVIWREINDLPPRQRVALLLGLKDERGTDCITMLSNAGIASITDVAAALQMQANDLLRIWDKLPMDDSAIGSLLGVTRQQVANIRKSARKRLINRTRDRGAKSP